MNSHKHARLTPAGRAILIGRVLDQGASSKTGAIQSIQVAPHNLQRQSWTS